MWLFRLMSGAPAPVVPVWGLEPWRSALPKLLHSLIANAATEQGSGGGAVAWLNGAGYVGVTLAPPGIATPQGGSGHISEQLLKLKSYVPPSAIAFVYGTADHLAFEEYHPKLWRTPVPDWLRG
jgi:hypothetical protein